MWPLGQLCADAASADEHIPLNVNHQNSLQLVISQDVMLSNIIMLDACRLKLVQCLAQLPHVQRLRQLGPTGLTAAPQHEEHAGKVEHAAQQRHGQRQVQEAEQHRHGLALQVLQVLVHGGLVQLHGAQRAHGGHVQLHGAQRTHPALADEGVAVCM